MLRCLLIEQNPSGVSEEHQKVSTLRVHDDNSETDVINGVVLRCRHAAGDHQPLRLPLLLSG